MKALDRQIDSSCKDTLILGDGKTQISLYPITARKMVELQKNKHLADIDRAIHLTAAKIRVNGEQVVYDDLIDGFTDDELAEIINFANNFGGDDALKNG
jgi:hypothetical protein